MEIKHINFRDHIFFYSLVPIIIVVSIVSYYRFMVRQDYIVGYEGVCDPTTEKCFVRCADDACTKDEYYLQAEKYAPDLLKECGPDITDCPDASICLPDDRDCSITYCDPNTDGDTCSNEVKKPNTSSVDELPIKDEVPI